MDVSHNAWRHLTARGVVIAADSASYIYMPLVAATWFGSLDIGAPLSLFLEQIAWILVGRRVASGDKFASAKIAFQITALGRIAMIALLFLSLGSEPWRIACGFVAMFGLGLLAVIAQNQIDRAIYEETSTDERRWWVAKLFAISAWIEPLAILLAAAVASTFTIGALLIIEIALFGLSALLFSRLPWVGADEQPRSFLDGKGSEKYSLTAVWAGLPKVSKVFMMASALQNFSVAFYYGLLSPFGLEIYGNTGGIFAVAVAVPAIGGLGTPGLARRLQARFHIKTCWYLVSLLLLMSGSMLAVTSVLPDGFSRMAMFTLGGYLFGATTSLSVYFATLARAKYIPRQNASIYTGLIKTITWATIPLAGLMAIVSVTCFGLTGTMLCAGAMITIGVVCALVWGPGRLSKADWNRQEG